MAEEQEAQVEGKAEAEADPTEKILELISLKEAETEIAGNLKSIGKSIKETEEVVLKHFAKAGIQSMNINGRTVYMQRRLFVGKRKEFSTQEICESLRACGHEDMVSTSPSYNASSLTALIREIGEEDVPGTLAEMLNIHEQFKICLRKS